MAVSKVDQRWAFLTTEELYEKQFTLVALTTSTTLIPAVSGSTPAFILMDTPKENEYGTVCMDGVEKCKCGETIKVGQFVAPSNTGLMQVAKTGQYIVGIALEEGESGALIPILSHAGSGAKV